MLSSKKLDKLCRNQKVDVSQVASQLVRTGLNQKEAVAAIKNWRKGLLRPIPRKEDIRHLATVLSVEVNSLVDWRSSYRYAPVSARKARLVTGLIEGRSVQDAMDILKFTSKRAAQMVDKVLKAAVADADEQQADSENLFVCQACVDDAGIRVGTKRWIAKDRGRAHSIRKKACHIHVTVTEL